MAEDESEDDFVASEIGEESSDLSQSGTQTVYSTQHQSKSNGRTVKGYLSNEYRNLLNIEIEGVRSRCQSTELESSQIGASKWTSGEKEALFRCLASRGPDDLPALIRAIRTKSEQEIRVYLLLLQDGVIAQEVKPVKLPKQGGFMYSDIPAAAEISSEGERTFGLAADALAVHVEKYISQLESEKFGDDWLINEDMAERMELLQQSEPEAALDANGSAEAVEDDSKDTREYQALDADIATLLCPSHFLQLSRSVFMNNGEDDDLNWQRVVSVSAGSSEPALFRTALEDFRNITVSITRRLVQATIFQATSRLRAEDSSRKDWSPLGAIREVDVRTAVDLLNLSRDSKDFWATAARRCRVDVYSDSNKFADGRPCAKSGYLLTHDEVETELGCQDVKDSAQCQDFESHTVDEDEIDVTMEESDMFTEEDAVDSAEDVRLDQGQRVIQARKQKRAMSPNSYLRGETSRVEALDKVASVQEESRLWELLRLDLPEHIAIDRQIHPSQLAAKPLVMSTGTNWRTHVEYEAEWEQATGMPTAKRFKHMEAEGKAGRSKREALLTTVQSRLDMEHGDDGSKDDTAMDAVTNGTDDEDKKPAASFVDGSTDEGE